MKTLKEVLQILEGKAISSSSQEKKEAYEDCVSILKGYMNQTFDAEELENVAFDVCEGMVANLECHPDDVFEFFKAGYKRAVKGE